MAKKELNQTTTKLKKLESVIGNLSPRKKQAPSKKTKSPKKPRNGSFKTREVIILLFITMFVSLIMGGIITYKLGPTNGKKIDSELGEFIENYEYITKNYNGDINKEELIDAALDGMLQKLDKNSVYLDSDTSENFNIKLAGSYSGLGIEVYNYGSNIIIYSVFKNSPAAKAGLKPGDIITAINGKSAKGLKSAELASLIKESKKETINLTYLRDKKEKTIKIKIGNIKLESVGTKTYNKDDKKIGYIAIGIFANNSYQQFKEKLTDLEKQNIDSLIIDLRSNSGGYLYIAENILSLFLDSKHPIYQIQKDEQITKHYSRGKEDKKYKIVILVDNNSASASEVVASALKEQSGATLVGTTTYGKGTVQEMQNLKSGDKYKITTKNWLTSKGTWVDGKGLTPDIEVKLDDKYFEDPKEENDNQLQTALKELVK